MPKFVLLAVLVAVVAVPIGAAPVPKAAPAPRAWPTLGGTPARNMVNPHERFVNFPLVGPNGNDEEDVRKWHNEWVLWTAELGSRAYGGPTVAGGKVFVGTNNERPRNPRDALRDKDGIVQPVVNGALYVLTESTLYAIGKR